jgi:hypothetical protein
MTIVEQVLGNEDWYRMRVKANPGMVIRQEDTDKQIADVRIYEDANAARAKAAWEKVEQEFIPLMLKAKFPQRDASIMVTLAQEVWIRMYVENLKEAYEKDRQAVATRSAMPLPLPDDSRLIQELRKSIKVEVVKEN